MPKRGLGWRMDFRVGLLVSVFQVSPGRLFPLCLIVGSQTSAAIPALFACPPFWEWLKVNMEKNGMEGRLFPARFIACLMGQTCDSNGRGSLCQCRACPVCEMQISSGCCHLRVA